MKLKYFLPLVTLLVIVSCGPGTYGDAYGRPVYIFPGLGLGTIIAVVVSWSRNHSILWAIIHGILGWFYVIYAILVRPRKHEI